MVDEQRTRLRGSGCGCVRPGLRGAQEGLRSGQLHDLHAPICGSTAASGLLLTAAQLSGSYGHCVRRCRAGSAQNRLRAGQLCDLHAPICGTDGSSPVLTTLVLFGKCQQDAELPQGWRCCRHIWEGSFMTFTDTHTHVHTCCGRWRSVVQVSC